MALNVARMKANFRSKMNAAFASQGFDPDDPNFNAYAQALCETVIEEIAGYAEVATSGQYQDGQYNGTTNVDVPRTVTATGTVN